MFETCGAWMLRDAVRNWDTWSAVDAKFRN
jgi:hypothetical protein